MRRIRTLQLIIIAVVIAFIQVFAHPQEAAWAPKSNSLQEIDTRAFIMGDGTGSYCATRRGLYKAMDMKEPSAWRMILALPQGANEIQCLNRTPNAIFVGTKRGVLRSKNDGATWENVFKTITPEKSDILCINCPDNTGAGVVIGTKAGVFASDDEGRRWRDISANIKNFSVACLAREKEYLYAGTNAGLYRTSAPGAAWDRLLVRKPPEENGPPDAGDIEESQEQAADGVRCIALGGKTHYVGINKYILASGDGGMSWEYLPKEGLSGLVNHIIPPFADRPMYSATTRGVFRYAPDRSKWQQLYRGAEKTANARCLIVKDKELWAVTDKGLYRYEDDRLTPDRAEDVEEGYKKLAVIFENEPTLKELRQAAIEYAEVSPGKIKRWRDEARLRALFPKVSLGLDRSQSTNYEIYTSATKDYVAAGPDDMSRGWDVAISWELGDLVWSDDQTNIDVRSRLMVQLRNDILDELRRVYYERRRVQFELVTNPPKDAKGIFEKEMRLEELTNALNDLTGNRFSQKDALKDRADQEVLLR